MDSEISMEKAVEVGDIFAASWGYDQTNINFYQVVKVSASGKSVHVSEIRSLMAEDQSSGPYYVSVKAHQDNFKGEVFRRKVKVWSHRGNRSVSINISAGIGSAFKLENRDAVMQETAAGFGH